MAKIFENLSRKKLEEMCENLRILAAERSKKIETQRNHIAFLSEKGFLAILKIAKYQEVCRIKTILKIPRYVGIFGYC